jgi:hypothetical protein
MDLSVIMRISGKSPVEGTGPKVGATDADIDIPCKSFSFSIRYFTSIQLGQENLQIFKLLLCLLCRLSIAGRFFDNISAGCVVHLSVFTLIPLNPVHDSTALHCKKLVHCAGLIG